jgi:hypothetical protein
MSNISQTVISKREKKADQAIVPNLIRWAGLSAVVAGIIFAVIQPIHPADVVASVTTTEWAIITSFKTAMCLLFLVGIGGIYARQANKAGKLGLAGFLLLSLSWSIQLAFVFAEAYILPPLATLEPKFVDGFLGVSYGRASEVNLGAIPVLYGLLVGGLYMLGGLVFGLATFRANVLPRRAAGLVAITATLTPLAVLFPHNIQRLAGIPMGLALAWLGFALWSERRSGAVEPVPASTRLQQTAAE